MLKFAVSLKKPVVIRYPRGEEETNIKFKNHEKIEEGKAEIIKEGENVTIIAIGKMVAKALQIAETLQQKGKEVEVINARFLKPLDVETIIKSIQKTKNVITLEDGTEINGLGTAIKELIVDNKLEKINIKSIAYPDEFIPHGSVEELKKKYLYKDIFDNLHK